MGLGKRKTRWRLSLGGWLYQKYGMSKQQSFLMLKPLEVGTLEIDYVRLGLGERVHLK